MPDPRRPSPDSRPSADFALVTVTHNSAPQLAALLASVARHLPGVRVIVVDCASSDDTVQVARGWPGALTVALGDNVGFGRANNRGIAEVSEAVTILVNPDVEVRDDSLRGLAAAAASGDRLLAPLVLSPDGSRQDTVHARPASVADVVRVLVPPAVVPGRAGLALAPWRSDRPRRVGWAVGCALAARTDTLRRLGPFDETIFLYSEDMELGLRAGDGGVPTWFWPYASVVHHRAHSSAVAFGGEPFTRLARARHDVIARRLGRRRAALDDVLQALTFAARIVAKRAVGRVARRELAQLRAVVNRRAGGPVA
jgi:N-acetylglucosaminyl-diphospho-decaprenol L-rhamnosyltransferase